MYIYIYIYIKQKSERAGDIYVYNPCLGKRRTTPPTPSPRLSN